MRMGFLRLSAGVLLLASVAWAQAPPPPCVDASTLAAEPQRGGIVAQTKRVFRMPSTTVNAPPGTNICPLTASQKFAVWLRRSYSPANLLAAGFNAAVWQATDTNPRGYGQGWDAYGARFGASLADAEATRFFQSFLLPVMVKEDPRYFRKGGGGAGARLEYAVSRVLVGRTDRGQPTFNFSAVGGAFAAAALSNTYLPDVDRNIGRTLASGGLSLASTAGWNLLSEFGPDLWRKVRGNKKGAATDSHGSTRIKDK